MKDLLKYLKNYKKELVFGPFFKLLEAVFELIVPVVMAKIIDNGIGRIHSDRRMQKGYRCDIMRTDRRVQKTHLRG